ncbi:MAG: hypothetical protein WAO28_03720 [Candidatus Microsaccharimonas sp.]
MNMHFENGWFYFGITGKKVYRGRSGKRSTHRQKHINGFQAFLVRVAFLLLIATLVAILIWLTPIVVTLVVLHFILRVFWRKGLTFNEDWTLGFRTAFQHR